MKRGANGDIFLKLLDRIRATIPGVAIRTSMIVGFPGETDGEFEELCQFVEAAQFDRLGVFAYSDQETSASFQLEGKIDERTIYNRRRSLMALQRRISRKRNKRLIGHEYQVLVEGPSKETELLWEARLSTQAPEIDGVCYINDFGPDEMAPRPGEIRKLRITQAHDYDLVGGLIDSAEPCTPSHGDGIANPFRILQIQPQSATAFGAIPVR
jgi:ribosomal protein S12 methylthiotransferase